MGRMAMAARGVRVVAGDELVHSRAYPFEQINQLRVFCGAQCRHQLGKAGKMLGDEACEEISAGLRQTHKRSSAVVGI
jgi:hypothetical protein